MSDVVFEIKDLYAFYDEHAALQSINLKIREKRITAIMGPSGCGKSTLLRCLNRLNDLIPGFSLKGQILFRGQDIYQIKDLTEYRRRVTMVFQKPNPFPMSIFDNVAYGLRIHGITKKSILKDKVEQALRMAALWDEVKDKLKSQRCNFQVVSSRDCASPGRWL